MSFYTPLEAAAKCALVSLNSTMKSNLSVEPPINLVMYEKDTFKVRYRLQMRLGDPYLAKVRKFWEEALKQALDEMPNLNWLYDCQESQENILID